MVQTVTKPLTIEEFLQLPETKPASEFIDGQIIQKPMPQGKHSTVQLDLGASINLVLKPQHIARAYSELRCTFGGKSIVPDVAVFTWGRIPRDENGEVSNTFSTAPDWTIEILSPNQSKTAEKVKKTGAKYFVVEQPGENTAYPRFMRYTCRGVREACALAHSICKEEP